MALLYSRHAHWSATTVQMYGTTVHAVSRRGTSVLKPHWGSGRGLVRGEGRTEAVQG
jgi:hypothetical protein